MRMITSFSLLRSVLLFSTLSPALAFRNWFNQFIFGDEPAEAQVIPLAELQRQFPTLPSTTLTRFHEHHGNDSPRLLNDYRVWQSKHPLLYDSTTTVDRNESLSLWNHAVQASVPYLSHQGVWNASLPPMDPVVFLTHAKDHIEGATVLQALSKRMDLDTYDRQTYVDILATYLEALFLGSDEDGTDTVTFLVDLRPGRGWSNPHYLRLLDTVEDWTQTLHRLHPGRVALYVLFPVPPSGRFVLNVYRPLLNADATPHALIPGPTAKMHEPVPYHQLAPKYVDASVVNATEALRKSLWDPPAAPQSV